MKLPESTKSKITKDKNSENEPHVEITEVLLIHCNIIFLKTQNCHILKYHLQSKVLNHLR